MAGWRKTLEVLPLVVICGVSFAAVQLAVSNLMGPELTDILSAMSCILCVVLVLKFWKPGRFSISLFAYVVPSLMPLPPPKSF